eukprot:scaffold5347_cov130-Cylindrotheca_fusiformis.AAC.13
MNVGLTSVGKVAIVSASRRSLITFVETSLGDPKSWLIRNGSPWCTTEAIPSLRRDRVRPCTKPLKRAWASIKTKR